MSEDDSRYPSFSSLPKLPDGYVYLPPVGPAIGTPNLRTMFVQSQSTFCYVTYVGDPKCPMVWVPNGGIIAVVARLIDLHDANAEVYITAEAFHLPDLSEPRIELGDYALGQSNASQWLFGDRVRSALLFCPLQYVIVRATDELRVKKQPVEIRISTMCGSVVPVDDFMLEQLGMKTEAKP